MARPTTPRRERRGEVLGEDGHQVEAHRRQRIGSPPGEPPRSPGPPLVSSPHDAARHAPPAPRPPPPWPAAGRRGARRRPGAGPLHAPGSTASRRSASTSLSSPLLLGDDEALVFSGTDAAGTQNAAGGRARLGPATIGRAASASGWPAASSWSPSTWPTSPPTGWACCGSAPPPTTAPWRPGCASAGRLPFTTLVGLTGAGLAVAGLAGQISALIARRRWSPPVAAAAGVATGAGGAMLGQEFGRLQFSYLSLGAAVAFAVAARSGAGPAAPTPPRGRRRIRRRAGRGPRRRPTPRRRLEPAPRQRRTGPGPPELRPRSHRLREPVGRPGAAPRGRRARSGAT